MQSNNNVQDTQIISNYDNFLASKHTQQEEDERQRRLMDKEESTARRVNAQGLASIVKDASFSNGGSAHSEEVERERRIQDRDEAVARRVNAQQAANLISSNHAGSLHSEEIERERRVQNRDEAVRRKELAHEVSSLIKEEEPRLDHSVTRQLEEAERQRRLGDRDECVARKVNANQASDSVRREAATIKARFVKRPSLWKLAKSSGLGKVLYNTISAAPSVAGRMVHDTAVAGDHVLSNAMPGTYGNAKHMVSTAASYLPSLLSIKNTASNIMSHIPFVTPHLATLADIKAAEELERHRRIAEDRNSCAIGNARRVSQMLLWAYPNRNLHRAYPSGFHRHTNSWEERERTRRLANKSEMETHRMLSSRLANIVSQLGWPFVHNAKGVLPLTNSARLAEQERSRILADQTGMLTTRFGANKIAGLLSDAFKPFDHGTMLRFTRSLEEKERRHRMKNPDAAVHGAHKQAALIKNIGAPFYRPTSTIAEGLPLPLQQPAELLEPIRKVGKKVKKNAPVLPQNVEAHMRRGSLLSSLGVAQEVTQEKPRDIDTAWMEEGERKSRMNDKTLQHLAMDNAHKVSGMIKKKQGPYKQRTVSFKPEVVVYPCPVFPRSPASAPLTPLPPVHHNSSNLNNSDSSDAFLPTLQYAKAPVPLPFQEPAHFEKVPLAHVTPAPAPTAAAAPALASTPALAPAPVPALQERSLHVPDDQTLPLHAAMMSKAPLPQAQEKPLHSTDRINENYVNPFVANAAAAAPLPPNPSPAKLSAPTAAPGSPYPLRAQTTPLYEEPFRNQAAHQYVPAMSKAADAHAQPHPAPPAQALSQWSFSNAAAPAASPAAALAPIVTPPAHTTPAAAAAAPPAFAAPVRPHTVIAPTPTSAPAPTFITHQHVPPASHPTSFAPQQQQFQQPQYLNTPSSTFAHQQQPAPAPLLSAHAPVHAPAHAPAYAPAHTPTPVLKPVSNAAQSFHPSTPASLPSHTTAAPAPVLKPVAPLQSALPIPAHTQQRGLNSQYQPTVSHQPTGALGGQNVFVPNNKPVEITTTTTITTPNAPAPARVSHGNPADQAKLVQSVRKLYDAETAHAQRERAKAEALSQKSSAFSRFRKQRHESAAQKHADNAQRHHNWLLAANPAMSAL